MIPVYQLINNFLLFLFFFYGVVLAGDKELVCSVIQRHPRILRKSVKSFLKPTAEFLVDLYGTELLCEVRFGCGAKVWGLSYSSSEAFDSYTLNLPLFLARIFLHTLSIINNLVSQEIPWDLTVPWSRIWRPARSSSSYRKVFNVQLGTQGIGGHKAEEKGTVAFSAVDRSNTIGC